MADDSVNCLSGEVHGPAVQARSIAGGVHVYGGAEHGRWAPPEVPAQLAPPPAIFVDRAHELATLSASVDRDQRPGFVTIVMIGGPGGVGKSALCLRWLHQIRDHYSDGQLYADLRGYSGEPPAQSKLVLGQFLHALGVPPDRVPWELGERAALFRTLTTSKRMIVMLDNAATTGQLRPLLPAGGACLVVVTTRMRLPRLSEYAPVCVPLGPLDEPAAKQLLADRAGGRRTAAEPDAASTVVQRCGGLPLALCAAAAQLATRPHRTIAQMADALADEQHRLAVLQTEEDDISVHAVFNASYRALPAEAARLYRLLGLLSGADFAVGVAAALVAIDPGETNDLLDVLVEGGLLEEIADRRYRFHDLVRAHARDRAEAESAEERHAAIKRTVDWYLRAAVAADLVVLPARWHLGSYYQDPPTPPVPLSDSAAAIAWLERELVNLLATLRLAADSGMNEVGWQLCEALWGLFLFRKHYDAWFTSHRIGLACAQACGDLRAQARMHNQLGGAYRSLRRHDEALDHFTQALKLDRAAGHRLGEALRSINSA